MPTLRHNLGSIIKINRNNRAGDQIRKPWLRTHQNAIANWNYEITSWEYGQIERKYCQAEYYPEAEIEAELGVNWETFGKFWGNWGSWVLGRFLGGGGGWGGRVGGGRW